MLMEQQSHGRHAADGIHRQGGAGNTIHLTGQAQVILQGDPDKLLTKKRLVHFPAPQVSPTQLVIACVYWWPKSAKMQNSP